MSAAAAVDLPALARTVQRNCDLADALHARDASLCTYLLAMREFYRWDTRAALGAPLPRAAVGTWIAQREARWEALRQTAARFGPLPLAGGIEPFDETAANALLMPAGLVYGAGVGRFGAPLFFLADLAASETRDGARVLLLEREHARGLWAPPALARGGTIVVRKDALRRWLWTLIEGAQRRARADALTLALRLQPGEADGARLEALAERLIESLVLHELGELRAGALLGSDWEDMLAALADRRAELVARAVRDLLADALVTLPALAERAAVDALLVWFAQFDGLRRALAPEWLDLYEPPFDGSGLQRIRTEAARQARRWHETATSLLTAWRHGGAPAARARAVALVSGQ